MLGETERSFIYKPLHMKWYEVAFANEPLWKFNLIGYAIFHFAYPIKNRVLTEFSNFSPEFL